MLPRLPTGLIKSSLGLRQRLVLPEFPKIMNRKSLMASPLETNKHVFYDNDGQLLQDGSIYVGQPSTDPRTNKKTVTFRDDAGGEFTAAQPLKTRNGKVVYNGKPIVALVNGEHSMLILDSDGKQIDYLAKVIPGGGGSSGSVEDFNELIRVGLTLDDVKAYDVFVGNLVRSIGRDNSQDGLGSDWLAVSNTGTPANDETLIDFSNGLQGVLTRSQLTQETAVIELDGDFDPGESVKLLRIGNGVFLSGDGPLNHTSGNSVSSLSGVIPAQFRPFASCMNVFLTTRNSGGVQASVRVSTSGTLTLQYEDSQGNAVQRTNSAQPPLINYPK